MTSYYSDRSVELATELRELALANIARFDLAESAEADAFADDVDKATDAEVIVDVPGSRTRFVRRRR